MIKIHTKLYITIWTLLVVASLSWNIYATIEHTLKLAIKEATALFNKDKAFRFWGASHGGVYVPPTNSTMPNEFLAHIPDRDIESLDGKKLTLMNPAYMVRQMMETYEDIYGVKGHITSDIHFRDETKPDNWELKALQAFKEGKNELIEIEDIEGKPYLRLMQPLYADKSCLKCHAFQGYKEGDLRGGVSLSLPMKPYYETQLATIAYLVVSHLFILLIGVFAIKRVSKRLQKEIIEKERSVAKLNETKNYLRYLLDSQPNIVIINDGHKIIDGNRAFLEFTGFASIREFRAKYECICDLFEEREDASYITKEREGVSWVEYIRANEGRSFKALIMKDGKEYRFKINLVYLEMDHKDRNIVTLTDITDIELLNLNLEAKVDEEVNKRRAQEESMIEQSHLAQMGEMLTMIAHHWRQPLNAAVLSVQILQDYYYEGELTKERVDKAVDTVVKRLTELSNTISLLSNLTKKQREARVFQAGKALKNICELSTSELLRYDIKVETDIEEGIELFGSTAFFTQIVTHLLKNAQEALMDNESSQKMIKISFKKDDKKAYLIVADNGGGIDGKIMPKIFDPFFTGKNLPSKVGLGLYVVKKLMEQKFQGSVEIRNIIGGTEAKVTFDL